MSRESKFNFSVFKVYMMHIVVTTSSISWKVISTNKAVHSFFWPKITWNMGTRSVSCDASYWNNKKPYVGNRRSTVQQGFTSRSLFFGATRSFQLNPCMQFLPPIMRLSFDDVIACKLFSLTEKHFCGRVRRSRGPWFTSSWYKVFMLKEDDFNKWWPGKFLLKINT